jgi:hypothetical protein
MNNSDAPRMAETDEPIPTWDRLKLWATNVWWAICKTPPKTLRGLRPVQRDDRRYETAKWAFSRNEAGVLSVKRREKKHDNG